MYAGCQISLINFSTAGIAGLSALKQKLVGKALDEAIRRETACNGLIAVEHEVLPHAENRLTLSDTKDMLGLNKRTVYYDVGDYVRKGADLLCWRAWRGKGYSRTWSKPILPAVCHIPRTRQASPRIVRCC